jgi:hypothetical protein
VSSLIGRFLRSDPNGLTLTEEQYRWLRQAAANEQTLKRTLKKMREISEQIFDRSSRKSTKPK